MQIMNRLAMILLSGCIVFWNVENFFDPLPQTENSSELEFTAAGAKHWTASRMRKKAMGISKLILSLSDSSFRPPRMVALAEVENERCLKTLVYGTPLRKFGYRYLHFDSHDPRGIDCALLYRGPKPVRSRAVPLKDSLGAIIPTRDILVAEWDSVAVLVCHFPSKRGSSEEAQRRRVIALNTLRDICDSLSGKTTIVIGDFNDTRSPLSDSLMSPMKEVPCSEAGSIKFEGRWEAIDRAFVSENTDAELHIINHSFLCTEDKKYGGVKPLRTYLGPRYIGGTSDHLPVMLNYSTLRAPSDTTTS